MLSMRLVGLVNRRFGVSGTEWNDFRRGVDGVGGFSNRDLLASFVLARLTNDLELVRT